MSITTQSSRFWNFIATTRHWPIDSQLNGLWNILHKSKLLSLELVLDQYVYKQRYKELKEHRRDGWRNVRCASSDRTPNCQLQFLLHFAVLGSGGFWNGLQVSASPISWNMGWSLFLTNTFRCIASYIIINI